MSQKITELSQLTEFSVITIASESMDSNKFYSPNSALSLLDKLLSHLFLLMYCKTLFSVRSDKFCRRCSPSCTSKWRLTAFALEKLASLDTTLWEKWQKVFLQHGAYELCMWQVTHTRPSKAHRWRWRRLPGANRWNWFATHVAQSHSQLWQVVCVGLSVYVCDCECVCVCFVWLPCVLGDYFNYACHWARFILHIKRVWNRSVRALNRSELKIENSSKFLARKFIKVQISGKTSRR